MDEFTLNKQNNKNFLRTLAQSFKDNKLIKVDEKNQSFTIEHFDGPVLYDARYFLGESVS